MRTRCTTRCCSRPDTALSSRKGFTKGAIKHEQELADSFGAKRVPGSGAGLHYKDDVASALDLASTHNVRIEAKGTAGREYILQARLYLGVWKRSIDWDATPIIAIKFRRGHPDSTDWALLDPLALPELDGVRCVTHSITAQSVVIRSEALEQEARDGTSVAFRWDVDIPRYHVRPTLLAVRLPLLKRLFDARRT